jgi:hypothetical protein
MDEASYIQRINEKVRCYAWKIHTSMHKGKLDCLYAWRSTHLWIEYKYQHTIPKQIDLTKKPYLSKIQQWEIRQLTASQQQVRIIVGTPEGGYMFDQNDIPNIQITNSLILHTDTDIIRTIHRLTKTPQPP